MLVIYLFQCIHLSHFIINSIPACFVTHVFKDIANQKYFGMSGGFDIIMCKLYNAVPL